MLGVCERTIRNHIDANKFPAPVKICGRQFWHPEVFYDWLDSHLRSSAMPPSPPTEQTTMSEPRRTNDLSPVQQAKAAQALKLSKR